MQTNINNEVTARSGEITRVEDLITAVNDSLANETTTRIDEDKKLADAIAKEIEDRGNADSALQTNINSEASKREEADTNLQATITTHTTNTVVHVTQEEKDNWNSKAETASIPTKVSQLENDKAYLISSDLTDISNRLASLESSLPSLDTRLSTLANSLSKLATRVAALESKS